MTNMPLKAHAFLSIDRDELGFDRYRQLFCSCRAAAQRIDPDCEILARYVDHRRVGWDFWLRDNDAVQHLLVAYEKLAA